MLLAVGPSKLPEAAETLETHLTNPRPFGTQQCQRARAATVGCPAHAFVGPFKTCAREDQHQERAASMSASRNHSGQSR